MSKLLWVIRRGYTFFALFLYWFYDSYMLIKFLPCVTRITSSNYPWIIRTFPLNFTISYSLLKCCLTIPPKHPTIPVATFFIVSKGDISMSRGTDL